MMFLNFILTTFQIILIEYLILFSHEIVHYLASLILGFKASSFYLIPFNLYKKDSKIKIKISTFKDNFVTSKIHFNSIRVSSKLEYNILIKKLRIFFWVGPVFDFLIFIILFSIGVSRIEYSYLALISLIHFSLSTLNFFNSDGKYAIGAKEDKRIAFDVVRNYTICGNGPVSNESQRILTDMHMEIAENIILEPFDVNDLWNFLNNISFYTNSLISYLNKDLLMLHPSTFKFLSSLEYDFDNIKKYDYRQVEKTSISLLYYFIYKKLLDKSFTSNRNILDRIYKGLNFTYHKRLFLLYLQNETKYINYLSDENNIPPTIFIYDGYTKLLLNLVKLYKNRI
jgi:hypothetical protein